MDEACEEAEWGLPWPWVTFTKNTYGIRRAALYTWGSGTGSGKTTLMKQLMVTAMRPDLMEDHSQLFPMPAPRKVASLFFEEQPQHTLKTMAGMVGSEEHTYELQSLMRISYVCSCMKQKTKT